MSRTAPPRAARPQADPVHPHLRLDPSVCDGVGICSHLAPDLVRVDSWGYPIVSPDALSSKALERQAEAAARACPRRALHVQ